MNDVIYALVTKPITQNIAIIRISGDGSFGAINKLLDKKLDNKQIQLRNIVANKKTIDQVMLLKFVKPNSFTGEDVIEIHCHGSLYVVDQIISSLNKLGLKQAQPGEFSQRAMLNGKIDLVQAEAINSLIFSKNVIEKEKSLEDLQGFKKDVIYQLEKEVTDMSSHLQTNIDYPEFLDVAVLSDKEVKPRVDKLIKIVKEIINNSNKIMPAIKGYSIAIIGKPNVGKSSLLNFLLNKDKAIVSNISGTTRDIVEDKIYFKGIEFNLIDTAGIRKTKDKIEEIGIRKAKEALQDASLIIDVYDGSLKSSKEDKDILDLAKQAKHHISVINKTDAKVINDIKGINISVKDKKVEPLIKEVEKYVDKILKDININNHNYFINSRQISIIEKIYDTLLKTKDELSKHVPLDIIMILLNEILDDIRNLSGQILDQKDIDQIFSKFCLGK